MKKPAKDASIRVARGRNVRKRIRTPRQASGKQVRLEKSRDKAAPDAVIAPKEPREEMPSNGEALLAGTPREPIDKDSPNGAARLRAMIEASVDCVITIDAHSTILEFNAAEVCATSVRIGGEQLFFCVTRDITERKQAEQTLRESEERFRALYNDVPSMYFTLNAAGTVLSVNEFGAAYLGYEPSELIGQPVQRVFVEADRAAAGEHIAETLADPSRVFDWELRKICKDGRIVWVRETARAVRSRDGELAVLINCADITKQRESEDALRRSERRFATFMDNLPGFAWMKDVKGRFVYRNKAMREIPGFRENWNGKSDADFWPPKVAAQYRASDLKVITSRAPLQTVASYPGDDRDRYVLASKFPIFDQAGAVTMVAGVSFEVTERIQAEQARAQLAAIVDSSNDAIIGRTFEDIVTSWNAAAEKIYGYSAAEILGRSIALLRPPEIPDLMSTMILRLKRGERIDNFEEIRPRKDGSRVHVSVSLSPIKSPTGEITGISEISRDITERKMIEKALESAEEQYRSIFNNAVDGIFRTSPEGKFLVANRAAAHIFGFASPEELIEERRDIARQGYVDPSRREEFKRLMQEQGVVNGFEYEAYRKDGSRVWISENTRAVHSPSGEILYFEGVLEDVTDRKRAEATLQMMRFCVDHADDGVFWVSPEGRVLYVNESTCKRLGYSESELLGLKIFDLDPDYRPGVWATHWEELKRRGTITLETRHRTKAGRVFPIEVNANYVCAGGLEFNFAFTRDITQRKQAEQKILAQLDELRRWQEVTLGREDRVLELKREINKLRQRLGEPARYASETQL